MKNQHMKTLWAIAVVVIVGALAYSVWQTAIKIPPQGTQNSYGVVCTQDALECPDGSWVGRSGPNCQFVCPIPHASSTAQEMTVVTHLNQKIKPLTASITPLAVIEDSRCPHGVQCIQAGTVRVQVKIESPTGTSMEEFSLGGIITTENEILTLVSVRPEKEATQTINPNDYEFVFRAALRH
jgi:hypothetical protein